ncbi:MAG: hypothetical protein RR998_03955 [Oscillospiraceae bacterium]
MQQYRLVCSEVTAESGERINIYGVACSAAVFEDVTTDADSINTLIRTLNELELEPSQLFYAVEDFLAEPSGKTR